MENFKTHPANTEIVQKYKPLTTESRICDFDMPSEIYLGGEIVRIPKRLRSKDVHFTVNTLGKPVRSAWINRTLGHLFNAIQVENELVEFSELHKSLQCLDGAISKLVKVDVLKNPCGPGFMGFSQAHENIPKDSIYITERSYELLCETNPVWRNIRTVAVTRFPNLGPKTTASLKLIIGKEELASITNQSLVQMGRSSNGKSLANLFADLLLEVGPDETVPTGVFDALYLHPTTLKDMEGDADGDLIYALAIRKGKPRFKDISMIREPGNFADLQDEFATLFKKANRVERKPVKEHLPNLFDEVPIGPVTYMIRHMLFKELKKPQYATSSHPMRDAWKVIGPIAIPKAEFVFDIRKGNWSDAEIEAKMREITDAVVDINYEKMVGNQFCLTVTSPNIGDVGWFLKDFPTLQSYINYITTGNMPERGEE